MKKISIIFSFLFIFILFFSCSIYAAEDTLPELPKHENMKDYVIHKLSTGVVKLEIFTSDNDLSMSSYLTLNNSAGVSVKFESNNIFNVYYYQLNGSTWEFLSTFTNKNSYSVNTGTILYSSINIYDTDKVTLFFQKTPQVEQTILAPIVEETETQKTLAEVVGILPLIIVVVVSLVGLRKALRMLSALLHRS